MPKPLMVIESEQMADGAVPLIASYRLKAATVFHRCLSATPDHRYVSGVLKEDTYLTTRMDHRHANTGFATVGRYALPIPLAASRVVQYRLPRGATILVGTVGPMFGQAGGGVEVQVPTDQPAKRLGTFVVPGY